LHHSSATGFMALGAFFCPGTDEVQKQRLLNL